MIELIRTLAFLLFGICLSGCGGNSSSPEPVNEDVIATEPGGLDIPDNSASDSYQVLIMGNSHVFGIGNIVETLIQSSMPAKQLMILQAPGSKFLDERINDGATLPVLNSQQWTHIILQAQKYSLSGTVIYPTTAAETWIRLSKQQGATPVLFPEHPRRGNLVEGRSVYELHQSIAENEKSCVAPVGLAWDEALQRQPTLSLYSADGNHASETGALLSSMVFYQIITGEPAVGLPFIETFAADEATQLLLREVVSSILSLYPACQY